MTFVRVRFAANPVTEKLPAGALPHVDLADVESGATGRWRAQESAERDTEGLRMRPGDVAYGRLRPYLRKTFLADRQTTCSTEFMVLRARSGWSSRFLAYCLRDGQFAGAVQGLVEGAKMPRASWEDIRDLRIPGAEFAEQERRADFLERESERIAMLHAELAAFQRPAYLAQQTEVHERLRVAGGELHPLHFAADPARPVMYGIVLPGEAVSEGVLLVKGGNVERNELDPTHLVRVAPEIEFPYRRARLKGGDLLITIRGSFGAVAQLPDASSGANITQDTARIAPSANTSGRYLLHALRAPEAQAQMGSLARGAGVRGLNIWDLKRIRLPIPSCEAQRKVADELDAIQRGREQIADEIRTLVATLAKYRHALITEAVTGRLDVTRLSEQQLDESAHAVIDGEQPEVLA